MSEWVKLPSGRFVNLSGTGPREACVSTLIYGGSTHSQVLVKWSQVLSDSIDVRDDDADALLRYLEEHAKFLGRD